ncbi:MAG: DUF3798 domain-containing protein, partial [Blautia sp.]|nr:DUF3798 domain-containing protein [Blautia sp.]
MMKKFVSLFLAAAMAFTFTAAPAFAASVETIELEDDEEEAEEEESAEEATEASGDYHIGIVTGSVSQSEDDRRGAEAFQATY